MIPFGLGCGLTIVLSGQDIDSILRPELTMGSCTDHLNSAVITAGKENNQRENAQITMLIEGLTMSKHTENRHPQNNKTK